MSAHAHGQVDPARVKLWDDTAHEHDMMSTRLLGFWLYMLGDSLIFAALFAAYGVLGMPGGNAGGPTAHDVANPVGGYLQTVVLFTSVLAYGLAMVELKHDRPRGLMIWLLVAFLIGAGFIGLEWRSLSALIAHGVTPQRSGFLSIFFAIIIVHGIHIFFGLLWMLVMLGQVAAKGFSLLVTYRLTNLKIFWLYQTLVWTFVYTFVYLKGSI